MLKTKHAVRVFGLYLAVFFIKLAKSLLQLIYDIVKILPQNNKKIFFLSRQASKRTIDYELLQKKLICKDKEVNIKELYRRNESLIMSFLNYLIELYHVATSKVIVLDGYSFIISNLRHRNTTKTFQLWHALGAVKKFGFDAINTSEGTEERLAKALCMHAKYDYIVSSSRYISQIFLRSFGYSKNNINIINACLPRVDLIKNRSWMMGKRKDIIKKIPTLKGKKIILYAPTFRKNGSSNAADFIGKIPKGCVIIFRPHFLDNTVVQDRNIVVTKDYTSLELLSVADYLVSDYSAIMLEACFTDVKIFRYIPDIQYYMSVRGINEEFESSIPAFGCYKKIDKLIEAIEKESKANNDKNSRFVNQYMLHNSDNSDVIAERILGEIS